MTQPFFTTNDQEFTRLEGLYVAERSPPASIKGTFLGVVGVCGECVRGPTGRVVEITSPARFREVFGGADQTANGTGGAVLGKIWRELVNKKFGKLDVVRVAAAAAVKASFTAETAAGGGGTAVLRIDAANVGSWGNNVGWKVQAATDGNANHFDLLINYLGTITQYKNLDISTTNDNTLNVLGTNDANLIVLTKLAAGRPVNNAPTVDGADVNGYTLLGATVAAFVSVAGADGTVAASDFTAVGGPIDLLTNYKGIGVVWVAGPGSANYSAIKTKIATNAPTVSDRMFLVGANDENVTISGAVTDAATMQSDRIIYCFNHAYTQNPNTATEMLVRPEGFMASILSQIDVDIHPGEEDTKQFTTGIIRLFNEGYAREDYISLREGGISGLEKDDGFSFVSGVTTSKVPGRTEITRRRMADYLLLSIAAFLKFSVKKKNTTARRAANKGVISGFSRDLAKSGRVVDQDDKGRALFTVDTEILNTPVQRAAGEEKIQYRAKLINHNLFLVLEAELGTGVVIEVQ